MEEKFEKGIQEISEQDRDKEETEKIPETEVFGYSQKSKNDKISEAEKKVDRKEEQIDKEKYSESDIKKMSEIAKKKLEETLDKKTESTISISKEGNEWIANVEVLEEEYIPAMNLRSMNDIIGIYEIRLSNKGELLNWDKKSSRKRGELK